MVFGEDFICLVECKLQTLCIFKNPLKSSLHRPYVKFFVQ